MRVHPYISGALPLVAETPPLPIKTPYPGDEQRKGDTSSAAFFGAVYYNI